MNVWVLDYDPRRAAQALCDQHLYSASADCLWLLAAVCKKYGVKTSINSTGSGGAVEEWLINDARGRGWFKRYSMALVEESRRRFAQELTSLNEYINELVFNEYAETLNKGFSSLKEVGVKCVTNNEPRYFAIGWDVKKFPLREEEDVVSAYRRYYVHLHARGNMSWSVSRKPPQWFLRQMRRIHEGTAA